MTIRRLPPHLINQIAAGEVVERPASVMKELVENSLDAGATKIQIHLHQAGQSRLQIIDNGSGMTPEDMALAIERHATSKLPDEDLFAIHTMGFRGEALPSIGAIARLTITSRHEAADQGWTLSVEGGTVTPAAPDAWAQGTKMDVRDLFYAIPARLKFLKSLKTELTHCTDMLHRIAMGHPEVAFTLTHEGRTLFDRPVESYLERAASIMGASFKQSAIDVRAERDGMTLTGFFALPTENRSTQKLQYLYVNGRAIKDRAIQAALKGAYGDLIPRDRFPVFLLYLTLPPRDVDVNVHPAKTEVRFQDPIGVKQFLTTSCRQILSQESHRSSVVIPPLQQGGALRSPEQTTLPASPGRPAAFSFAPTSSYGGPTSPPTSTVHTPPAFMTARPSSDITQEAPQSSTPSATNPLDLTLPLGQVKGQIFNTYILCEAEDSLVIVDQHAAHERLIYEKMKQEIKEGNVRRQLLLVPERVDITPYHTHHFDGWLPALAQMGLILTARDDHSMHVTEVPSIMKDFDIQKLVKDLAAELDEHDDATALEKQIDHLLATFSCHGSIRAGRRLSPEEQDAMLRQIETTNFAGQCNHGRPTHVRLSKKDLHHFFERL